DRRSCVRHSRRDRHGCRVDAGSPRGAGRRCVAASVVELWPLMQHDLRRTLTLRDLIFIVVGTVIGSGIFLTPGAVVRSAGSGGVALIVWIVGGVLSLLGALTFAELGAVRPESGGMYTYLRDAFGRLLAFLY